MRTYSGVATITDVATPLCPAPAGGVLVRNMGLIRVFLGGPDVSNGTTAYGFPLDPGTPLQFPGGTPKESVMVPAPAGDPTPAMLYARCAAGGTTQVSWISVW